MKKNTVKFTIGLFVIGALTLIFAAAMLLKTITFPSDNAHFILFFDHSLKGLITGSPVYFKGVTVGTVDSIQVTPLLDDNSVAIPVIISIDSNFFDAMYKTNEFGPPPETPEEAMEILVEKGLQGGLTLVSMVSGQLAVQLDMNITLSKETEIPIQRYEGLLQIPTNVSGMDALLEKAQQVPLAEISYELLATLKSINNTITEAHLQDLSITLNGIAEEFYTMIKDFNTPQPNGLTPSQSLAALLNKFNNEFDEISKNITQLLSRLSKTTRALDNTLDSTSSFLDEDSAFITEFAKTMQALQMTLSSIANLANLIEQNPNSLLFGKQ